MAFDPKKWTIKTQEAFAAAIDQAKELSNPELTPDHVLGAMMRQDGTIVPAVLAKLGQAPLMVRNKVDERVAGPAEGVRRRRTADEQGADQQGQQRREVPEGSRRRLLVRRAPAARDERPTRRRLRRAARRAEGRARFAPHHRSEPRGEVRRPREVRPGPHRTRRRTARSIPSSDATTRSGAPSRCCHGAPRTTRC